MGSVTQTKQHTVPAVGSPDAVEELMTNLETTHTKPLWAQMNRLVPPLPNPSCIPHKWAYDEIRPHLLKAGELITEKQAERRVLMLVNPAREAPYTTDTIYAGLQLVMPNETAPAHRHVAFAMRFIIEGDGGFTAVHGRRIKMQRGDVILTPTMNWHDHGKDGSGPMIWLDALDLPNFVHYPVHFVEHYKEPRYPAEDVDSSQSPLVFPWSRMKAVLDEAEGHWASRDYVKADGRQGIVTSWHLSHNRKTNRKSVSKTLASLASRLNGNTSSPRVRETASSVYHIIEGTGHTKINDQTIIWKKGDTFCIPAWYSYQHFADAGETVYLYRFDDTPMLKALGYYRKEGEEIVVED